MPGPEKNTYTATWTVDFPPAAVMAKVSPAFYMEYYGDTVGMLGTQIASIRHRLPNNADQTVSAGNNPAIFDGKHDQRDVRAVSFTTAKPELSWIWAFGVRSC
jgi:hypothetical protein